MEKVGGQFSTSGSFDTTSVGVMNLLQFPFTVDIKVNGCQVNLTHLQTDEVYADVTGADKTGVFEDGCFTARRRSVSRSMTAIRVGDQSRLAIVSALHPRAEQEGKTYGGS